MYMYLSYIGTTTISLSDEAYRILNAQKLDGIFLRFNITKVRERYPSAILTYLKERGPNPDLADSVEKASKELCKNLKL